MKRKRLVLFYVLFFIFNLVCFSEYLFAANSEGEDASIGISLGSNFERKMFKSGPGFIAKGEGTYERNMANPDAVRISNRKAHIVAYISAQKALAEGMKGFYQQHKTDFDSDLKSHVSANDTVSNYDESLGQSESGFVDVLLRAFTVYKVEDDGQGTVCVYIVTSPKTMANFERVNTNTINTADIDDGLKKVKEDIKRGLVPVTGYRHIACKKTGEVAFVSFGCAVVRTGKSAAMNKQHRLMAQKMSLNYARGQMIECLKGSQVKGGDTVSEQGNESNHEFKEIQDEESKSPLNNKIESLPEPITAFKNTAICKTAINTMSSGKMPPGIANESFLSKDGGWCYSICIYMPSLSAEAAKASKKMDEIRNQDEFYRKPYNNMDNKPNYISDSYTPTSGAKAPSSLPSGQVTDDDDL